MMARGMGAMSYCTPSRGNTAEGRSRSHHLRRRRRAVEGPTREGAGDEPYVALGDPEGVADVAGAIPVHVTQRGIRYCGAQTGTYVELRDRQGVANVHYAISVHVPTAKGPRDDLVDRAVAPAAQVDDVELAPRVEAERADVERAAGKEGRGVVLRGPGIAAAEAPDEAAAEVRVEVAPAQIGHAAAAVDEAAGDRAAGRVRRLGARAAALRRAVAVVEDGEREPGHGARGERHGEVRRVEAVQTLHDVPAVVATARERGGGHEVDLLEEVLPDVGDVEVAGGAVEGVPPRVAQPLGEALGRGGQRRDVDPQQLPQVGGVALRVAHRIPAAAAVAHADVEHAVGAEQVEPAVVVREGLVDGEHQLRAQRVGLVRGGGRVVARHHRVAVRDPPVRPARVVHVEEPVVLEVGVEGDAQQALLAAAALDLRPVVEDRGSMQGAALDQADPPGLLDDEEPVRIEQRRGHVGRVREARGDEHGLDRGPADGRDAGADGRGVLELTGGRAAVAARRVAVVALLGALDHAVAAGRGGAGDRVVGWEHGARERRGEGKQGAARVHRPSGRNEAVAPYYRRRRLDENARSR